METLHTDHGMNLQQNSPSYKAGIERELTEELKLTMVGCILRCRWDSSSHF